MMNGKSILSSYCTCAVLSLPVFLIMSSLHLALSFQDDGYLDSQITLLVEDTLEDTPQPTFTHRSTINIRSVKSGNAVIYHDREWDTDSIMKLKKLAEDDGLYRIRVQQKGAENRDYISTFTKACLIYESRLSEIFSIMLDDSGSAVTGVSLFTPVSVCSGVLETIEVDSFNSSIITRSPIQAPVPDTATFIQKIDAMKTEKAEGKDNRSFLAKYWMYIVPVVLILLISGGGQDAAGGGGR